MMLPSDEISEIRSYDRPDGHEGRPCNRTVLLVRCFLTALNPACTPLQPHCPACPLLNLRESARILLAYQCGLVRFVDSIPPRFCTNLHEFCCFISADQLDLWIQFLHDSAQIFTNFVASLVCISQICGFNSSTNLHDQRNLREKKLQNISVREFADVLCVFTIRHSFSARLYLSQSQAVTNKQEK